MTPTSGLSSPEASSSATTSGAPNAELQANALFAKAGKKTSPKGSQPAQRSTPPGPFDPSQLSPDVRRVLDGVRGTVNPPVRSSAEGAFGSPPANATMPKAGATTPRYGGGTAKPYQEQWMGELDPFFGQSKAQVQRVKKAGEQIQRSQSTELNTRIAGLRDAIRAFDKQPSAATWNALNTAQVKLAGQTNLPSGKQEVSQEMNASLKDSRSVLLQAGARLKRYADLPRGRLESYQPATNVPPIARVADNDAGYKRALATNSPPPTQEGKEIIQWADSYSRARFPAGDRNQAKLLLQTVQLHFRNLAGSDSKSLPQLRKALEFTLRSENGSAKGALTMLREIAREISSSGNVANLKGTQTTPLQALRQDVLERMSAKEVEDLQVFTDTLQKAKNAKTAEEKSVHMAKAETMVKKFAEKMGGSNVREISITPRNARDVIVMTHQQESFASNKDSFAFDVSYVFDAKVAGATVPLKGNWTAWYNPGEFARAGTPYVDSKATDATKSASTQMVLRGGAFEMGIQGKVSPAMGNAGSAIANVGFSIIARGPHVKSVVDVSSKGKLTYAPSLNLSVDMSAYASLGALRAGPYFELGRLGLDDSGKVKPGFVFDPLDIGINPDFFKWLSE
jgi:hypothetical protein